MISKDVHILILRIHEYFIWQRNLTDVLEGIDLDKGEYVEFFCSYKIREHLSV